MGSSSKSALVVAAGVSALVGASGVWMLGSITGGESAMEAMATRAEPTHGPGFGSVPFPPAYQIDAIVKGT